MIYKKESFVYREGGERERERERERIWGSRDLIDCL
jgi:hypothetical protein